MISLELGGLSGRKERSLAVSDNNGKSSAFRSCTRFTTSGGVHLRALGCRDIERRKFRGSSYQALPNDLKEEEKKLKVFKQHKEYWIAQEWNRCDDTLD
ncbi:hypothetical protein RRG08_053177 [Elysia crispata]|uniref:Uncharacterized protein n=1 Tax=Elysia crispata TaxID=231223 RepID=A0AAE0YQG7_9GAST|nr:hypothetical protein RRG08_053177 [Elysia crispata]